MTFLSTQDRGQTTLNSGRKMALIITTGQLVWIHNDTFIKAEWLKYAAAGESVREQTETMIKRMEKKKDIKQQKWWEKKGVYTLYTVNWKNYDVASVHVPSLS